MDILERKISADKLLERFLGDPMNVAEVILVSSNSRRRGNVAILRYDPSQEDSDLTKAFYVFPNMVKINKAWDKYDQYN